MGISQRAITVGPSTLQDAATPAAKPRRQVLHPKKTKWGRVPADITHEELQEQFHLPMEHAAQRMGLGLTVLKQICRKYGISRWPFRKVLQLRRMAAVAKDPGAIMPLIMELQVPLDSRMWVSFDGKGKDRVQKALQLLRQNPEKQRQLAQRAAAQAAAADEASDGEDATDNRTEGVSSNSPQAAGPQKGGGETGSDGAMGQTQGGSGTADHFQAPPGGLRIQVPKPGSTDMMGSSPASLAGFTPGSSGFLDSNDKHGSSSLPPIGCHFDALSSPPLMLESPHQFLPRTYSMNSNEGLDSVAGSMGPVGTLDFDDAAYDFGAPAFTPRKAELQGAAAGQHAQDAAMTLQDAGATQAAIEDRPLPNKVLESPYYEEQPPTVLQGKPIAACQHAGSSLLARHQEHGAPAGGVAGVAPGGPARGLDTNGCQLPPGMPQGSPMCGTTGRHKAVHHITAVATGRSLVGPSLAPAEGTPGMQPSNSISSSFGRDSNTTTMSHQLARHSPRQTNSAQGLVGNHAKGQAPRHPVPVHMDPLGADLEPQGPTVDDVLDEHLAGLEMPMFALNEFPELKEAWHRVMMYDTPRAVQRSRSEIPCIQQYQYKLPQRATTPPAKPPVPPQSMQHLQNSYSTPALHHMMSHTGETTPYYPNKGLPSKHEEQTQCDAYVQPQMESQGIAAAMSGAHPVGHTLQFQRHHHRHHHQQQHQQELCHQQHQQQQQQQQPRHQYHYQQQTSATHQTTPNITPLTPATQHGDHTPLVMPAHLMQAPKPDNQLAVQQVLQNGLACGYQASDLRLQAQNAQQLAQQTHQAHQQLLQARQQLHQHAGPGRQLAAQLLQLPDGTVVYGQPKNVPRYVATHVQQGVQLLHPVQQSPNSHMSGHMHLLGSPAIPLQCGSFNHQEGNVQHYVLTHANMAPQQMHATFSGTPGDATAMSRVEA